MDKLEKVIKGLYICTRTYDCMKCPYFNPVDDHCTNRVYLMNDAMELLKEQADTINTQQGIIALQNQQIERAFSEVKQNE